MLYTIMGHEMLEETVDTPSTPASSRCSIPDVFATRASTHGEPPPTDPASQEIGGEKWRLD